MRAPSEEAAEGTGTNTVDSGDIKNGQVKKKDIGKNAVTAAKVSDGSLTGADVLDNSLTGADLNESTLGEVPSANSASSANTANTANSANTATTANGVAAGGVDTAAIQDDAVTGPKIAAGAVDSSEIAPGAVRGSQLLDYHVHTGAGINVTDPTALDGDFQQVTANASCTAGEQLVGFYAEWTSGGDENALQEVIPNFTANSVTARGITDNGRTETFRAIAVCLFD
jgi:hypothetical protein